MSDAMCNCLQISRGEKEGTFILFMTKIYVFFVYPNLIAGMKILYLCQEGHVTAGVCLSVHSKKLQRGFLWNFQEMY